MEVEILGVLKDSLGLGQDMVVAKLHGRVEIYWCGRRDEWQSGSY